jgi:hypothetical protein
MLLKEKENPWEMLLERWLMKMLIYGKHELLPWIDIGNHKQINQLVGPHVRVKKLLISER